MGMLVTLMKAGRPGRAHPHHSVTLPQGWVEWLTGQGYRTDKLEMELRGGELVLRPVRAQPEEAVPITDIRGVPKYSLGRGEEQ